MFQQKSERLLWISLAVAVFLLGVSKAKIESKFTWPYPTVNELQVSEHYMTDLGALLLGAHRLAADIAYIQFLQYYGVPEDEEEHNHQPGHIHDFAGGAYPLLLDKATRYMRLDPFFNGGIIEAAGALAFNQKRNDQALRYLREAIQRDPGFFRYHIYLSAILYKNKEDDGGLTRMLEEAAKYPDCPAMLRNILGNLFLKYGDYQKAVQTFLIMHKTAASDNDRSTAEKGLQRVIEKHPAVIPLIKDELDSLLK